MDLKQGIEILQANATFRTILATLLAVGNFLNGAEVTKLKIIELRGKLNCIFPDKRLPSRLFGQGARGEGHGAQALAVASPVLHDHGAGPGDDGSLLGNWSGDAGLPGRFRRAVF